MNECPYKTWIEKSEELWRKREDMMTSKTSSLGCSMNDEERKWLEWFDTWSDPEDRGFETPAAYIRRLLAECERLEAELSKWHESHWVDWHTYEECPGHTMALKKHIAQLEADRRNLVAYARMLKETWEPIVGADESEEWQALGENLREEIDG